MLELLTVISITLFVAVVPGPDFAVVTRNALIDGRGAGIATALGIALALGVHITYALAGIGLIISQSIFLFNTIKLIGAAYLIILGIMMFRGASNDIPQTKIQTNMTKWRALRWGFLTNVTNPKATMFALSIFVQVTSPDTPLAVQIGYGIIMASGVFGWFVLVSCFFTYPQIRTRFLSFKLWLERSFGIVLGLFGLGIALTTNNGR